MRHNPRAGQITAKERKRLDKWEPDSERKYSKRAFGNPKDVTNYDVPFGIDMATRGAIGRDVPVIVTSAESRWGLRAWFRDRADFKDWRRVVRGPIPGKYLHATSTTIPSCGTRVTVADETQWGVLNLAIGVLHGVEGVTLS